MDAVGAGGLQVELAVAVDIALGGVALEVKNHVGHMAEIVGGGGKAADYVMRLASSTSTR